MEAAAQAVLDARAQFMSPVGDDVRRLTSKPRIAIPPNSEKDQSLVTSSPTNKQCTLADLYDPITMPPALVKAHTELDRAVDRCYRKEPFASDRARVEYLFQLYEKLTAPLIAAANAKPKRRKSVYAKSPVNPTHPDLTPEKAFGDDAHFYGKEEPPPYHTP